MSQLLLSVPSRSISPSSTKLSYYSAKTGFKIDAMLEHFESLSYSNPSLLSSDTNVIPR